MKSGKGAKSKKKEVKGVAIPKIMSIGKMDVIMKIVFTDSEVEKYQIDLETISDIKSLKFLEDKTELWSKFIMTSMNDHLNGLLSINRSNKKKSYVELVPFGYPKFEEETEFFERIFKFVSSANGININENALDDGGDFGILVVLIHGEQKVKVTLGSPTDDEKEEESPNQNEGNQNEGNQNEEQKEENKNEENKNEENKNEENKNEENKNEENKNEEQKEENKNKKKTLEETLPGVKTLKKSKKEEKNEEEKKERTETQKAFLPETFSRGETVLEKIIPKCTSYDMLFFDYSLLSNIPGNFDLMDLIELLFHLKQNKNSPLIVFYYPLIEQLDEDHMCQINSLFYLTDIYFFDLKDSVKTFQSHYDIFTSEKTKSKIDTKKVFDYFISGIASATLPTVEGHKLGVFIDEFNKLNLVEAEGKKANNTPYDCRVYPQINPHNTKLVQEYKDVIQNNKEFLYNIFIGGFLGEVAMTYTNNKQGTFGAETIYISYLTGLEIVKRAVELFKENLPLPLTPDFWTIKISKSKIEEDLKKVELGSKEDGFVLDCCNKDKSTMKDYVALYDYHLKSFFSSQIIRKDLKEKGFINTKGYIMYDPVYRSVMGSKCKNTKKLEENEMNKKLMNSIKSINLAENIKQKEANSKSLVLSSTSPTDKKIPIMKTNEYIIPTKTKKLKKKKDDNKDKEQKNEENQNEQNQNEQNQNEPNNNEPNNNEQNNNEPNNNEANNNEANNNEFKPAEKKDDEQRSLEKTNEQKKDDSLQREL